MFKLPLALIALLTLTACNSYNPAAAAAQDAHNERLKQTVSPEGQQLPENIASLRVAAQ
ncbi:hypothetical protein [Loktanella sp. R86503]|uniref:hypothetical protein n=1 Tax=Loktanella sp. R86503 TaxID=3093847 RepID=UPI0036DAE720